MQSSCGKVMSSLRKYVLYVQANVDLLVRGVDEDLNDCLFNSVVPTQKVAVMKMSG